MWTVIREVRGFFGLQVLESMVVDNITESLKAGISALPTMGKSKYTSFT